MAMDLKRSARGSIAKFATFWFATAGDASNSGELRPRLACPPGVAGLGERICLGVMASIEPDRGEEMAEFR